MKMEWIIESPTSGFLKKIDASDGSVVEKMQPVGIFDDEEEQLSEIKLALLRTVLSRTKLKMNQRNLASVRGTYEAQDEATRELQHFRTLLVREAQDGFEVGESRRESIEFAEVGLLSAKFEQATLDLEISSYQMKTEQGVLQLSLTEKILEAQEALLAIRRENLVVRSLHHGRITWFAFEGGFIERGDALALVREF